MVHGGVMAWLTTDHVPHGESDSRQTSGELSLGLTFDLTDHQRSDGLSLLPSEEGFDFALLFNGDCCFEGPLDV
ncbi:hypothetical protein HAX54_027501 [Datura stramonium]|uniref:Uncharacterized protein n=1 Tax=Datura stramonium TaxID=4076 RepID=A0ABS8V434_DATST|nr:hypothetical protein [Datura stramonium]